MIFEKQVVNGYKSMMHKRCDDTETVFYFSNDNFAGLQSEPYTFNSSMGHTLKGYIYSYDGYKAERIIVFDHGFGGGHRAYMKEIEMLCRNGYRVLSYDHTGCMESGGESPNGLAQSLCDLNDCINSIKTDKVLGELDISVIGHSWGAFSTLNITALHPEISHIVAISGFVSVEEMIKTFFAGPLKPYRKAVLKLEKDSNPDFFEYNALQTLKNSKTKALLIYSDNDKLCRVSHYHMLKNGLEGKENISFMLVKSKGHNPNYTENALKLLGEFGRARAKLLRKKNLTSDEKAKFVSSFDFEKMTEQDACVWQKIFSHLEDNN